MNTKTVHEGLKPNQCPICQSTFCSNGNLNKHTKTVHGNESQSSSMLNVWKDLWMCKTND